MGWCTCVPAEASCVNLRVAPFVQYSGAACLFIVPALGTAALIAEGCDPNLDSASVQSWKTLRPVDGACKQVYTGGMPPARCTFGGSVIFSLMTPGTSTWNARIRGDLITRCGHPQNKHCEIHFGRAAKSVFLRKRVFFCRVSALWRGGHDIYIYIYIYI